MAQTILVADPNIGFGMMLSQELEQHGYQVETVSSSEEVIESLKAKQPDMAVLDMELTDPDALSLARQLRGQYPGMRLMIIPYMGEEAPEEVKSIPVQGVLSKPFFMPALPGQIAEALQAPLDGSVLVEVTSLHDAPVAPPPPPPAKPGFGFGARPAERESRESREQREQREREQKEREQKEREQKERDWAQRDREQREQRERELQARYGARSSDKPAASPAPAAPSSSSSSRLGSSSRPSSYSDTPTASSPARGGSSAAATGTRKWEKRQAEITSLMSSLAREVTADVVMLTVGDELALSVGRLEDPDKVQTLAQAVITGRVTCLQIGKALANKESPCLEHNIAGKDFVLYALSVGGDAMLGVVIRGTSALGLLRHRSREAVEGIIRLGIF